MAQLSSLAEYLISRVAEAGRSDTVNETVLHVASAAAELSTLIGRGSLEEDLAAGCGNNVQGEVQKRLDVIANDEIMKAAREAPVAVLLSEEINDPVIFDQNKPIALAVDPLDGSSNIEVNAAIGTIFSLLPANSADPASSFLQPGRNQLAAGCVIYGPQTRLALTLGSGTTLFTLDREKGEFFQTGIATIAPQTSEFAINASNYRHWTDGIRCYVNDCLAGEEGPLGKDYNMRWLAAVAGEAQRILARGGIFIYPPDKRNGYGEGRLRLIYEGNPIAFLIEQAGGDATDGQRRILDLEPQTVHQRTGLCFGASEEVARLARYLAMPVEDSPPLFGRRGLFIVKG